MFKLTLALFTCLLLCATPVYPQHGSHDMTAVPGEKPTAPPQIKALLLPGFGTYGHPVTTTNAEAQSFFDQGLRLVYAFNKEEAVRSFKRAAELDPQMAMAYWGVALGLGSNLSLRIGREQQQAPYEAIQKALSLASKAPDHERAYIEALSKRYSIDPAADLKKLAADYSGAMRKVWERYPDDPDAGALYAESLILLRPDEPFWLEDGKPAPNTEEIVGVLESVLRRNPDHVGAIHFYIHAVESSPHPERALSYALRLKELMPGAGHIVHMPSHIYMRIGDYAASAQSNKEALLADESYFKFRDRGSAYRAILHTHTLQYLAISYAMEGRYADALDAAKRLEANVVPYLKIVPPLEHMNSNSTLILVKFRRWDEILKLPQPAPEMRVSNIYWHFARGLAYAGLGQVEDAEGERQKFIAAEKALPPDTAFGPNPLAKVLRIAEGILNAKISSARRDDKSAIEFLQSAVEAEDALVYDEPPPWYLPARESLGGMLLRNGKYAEAEAVFRADLKKHMRNGRSLFGLLESLKAQKKSRQARLVKAEFAKAWKDADTQLKVEDL